MTAEQLILEGCCCKRCVYYFKINNSFTYPLGNCLKTTGKMLGIGLESTDDYTYTVTSAYIVSGNEICIDSKEDWFKH